MEHRLVLKQRLVRRAGAATISTGVHKHVGKMFGLNVVPHIRSRLVRKLLTQGAEVVSRGVFPNVL